MIPLLEYTYTKELSLSQKIYRNFSQVMTPAKLQWLDAL